MGVAEFIGNAADVAVHLQCAHCRRSACNAYVTDAAKAVP